MKEDRIVISMPVLLDFLDLLMEYGQARDHIEINNSAHSLKAFFFSEDSWLKEDLLAWAEGMLEYKEKPNLIEERLKKLNLNLYEEFI